MLQNKYYSILTFAFGSLSLCCGVVFGFFKKSENEMGQLLNFFLAFKTFLMVVQALKYSYFRI